MDRFTHLPLELHNIIGSALGVPDVRSLCRLQSRLWFTYCPLLWQEVKSLDRVLALILGYVPRHGQGQVCQKTMSEVVEEVQYKRFLQISPFIRSLTIYRETSTHPLYLSEGVVKFLVGKGTGENLLPNLQCLSLGSTCFVPGMSRDQIIWLDDPYSLRLAMIFLPRNIHTVSLSGWGYRLQLERVYRSSKRIRHLSICVTRPGVGEKADQQTWTPMWAQFIPRWAQLENLSISTCLLRSDTSLALASITNLASLHLLGPFAGDGHFTFDWSNLSFDDSSFPSLLKLSISEVTFQSINQILRHSNFMPKLSMLHLCALPSRSQDFGMCFSSLADNRSALTSLTIDAACNRTSGFYVDCTSSIRLLHSFKLETLEMQDLDLPLESLHLLTSFNPMLSRLNIRCQFIPFSFLQTLADVYPTLQHLTADFERNIDVFALPLRTFPAGSGLVMALESGSDWDVLPPCLDKNGRLVAMCSLAKYLCSIWPELEVFMRESHEKTQYLTLEDYGDERVDSLLELRQAILNAAHRRA